MDAGQPGQFCPRPLMSGGPLADRIEGAHSAKPKTVMGKILIRKLRPVLTPEMREMLIQRAAKRLAESAHSTKTKP